jgi:uncharacterized protein YndB with AHSA1/START domain
VLEIYSQVDDQIVAAIGGVNNMTRMVLIAFLLSSALTMVTMFRRGQITKTRHHRATNEPTTTKADRDMALMFRLGGGAGLGALLGLFMLAAE